MHCVALVTTAGVPLHLTTNSPLLCIYTVAPAAILRKWAEVIRHLSSAGLLPRREGPEGRRPQTGQTSETVFFLFLTWEVFFFFHYNSLCFHVNWARHAKAEEATPEEPLSHGDHIEEDLWLTRLVWTVGSAFAKRGWTLFPCSLREITARHASSHWAAWPHSHRHGSNAHTGESEPCHCQHALPDWLSVKLLSGLCNCFVFYRK